MLKIIPLQAIALAAIVGTGQVAKAQTKIPPSPKDFVQSAAQTDQYEIAAATLAEAQSKNPRVRTFAQDMLRDHKRTSEDSGKAAVAAGLPQPEPGMSSDQASLLGSLQSLRGAEFDKAYARQQALGHTQAVAVYESFAEKGANQTLRNGVSAELPIIRNHLKMARELQTTVGE